MRVIGSPEELELKGPEELTVTVGNFDGVHLGHRAVLSELLTAADSRAGVSLAVTFDPHPASVVGADGSPLLLTPIDEKIELLRAAGLSALLVVTFTTDVARRKAADFLVWLSVGRGSHLVLGYDFHMGRGRSCDVARLSELGAEMGYGLDVVPPVEHEGRPISSSRIRECVRCGDVEGAAAMLGSPFTLAGTVVPGDGTGRLLKTPTANLEVPRDKLLPADGVYFVSAGSLGGRPGLLYVGRRPTFGVGERRAEVHILDLESDLYGTVLSVDVRERLREDAAFGDAGELAARISADIQRARALAERDSGRVR